MNKLVPFSLAVLLTACSSNQSPTNDGDEQPVGIANDQEPLTAPEPGTPGGLPDEPGSPAGEPRGPIDPKSAEGAGQVVQQFGALIEQKKFDDANRLWTSQTSAAAFQKQLNQYSEAHLQIGAPGRIEGAAGSSYIKVPVVVYGRRTSGPQASAPAEITLRRVNDVPGATEEQRRWRIERIELKPD